MHAAKWSKKNIAFAIVLAGLTVLSVALFIVFSALGNTLLSQQAAERFRGESEEHFTQLSVFFPNGEGILEDDVNFFREKLEADLLDISLESDAGKTLYKDAYCSEGTLTVYGDKGSATVTTLGVGGDWFFFHPLYLRDGHYISNSDLMHDAVVLDRELAWRLFGGIDVAGMTVTIGNKPYIIAGVISHEDDFATKQAYSGEPIMFMSCDELFKCCDGMEISSYELICINPVKGFAKGSVSGFFSDAYVVENSSRYSLSSIFGILKNFGKRSMNVSGIIYPYWENAARYIEDIAALILVLAILFGILPAIAVIVIAVKLLKILFKRAWETVPEKIMEWNDRRYEKRRGRMR